MAPSPRNFSTASRAYPSFFPMLNTAPKISRKVLTPVAMVLAAGVVAKQYTDNAAERQARLDLQDAEMRAHNAQWLDAYGDRSDLASLEKAMMAYSKREQK
ncbi:hypothetical protein CFIMG_008293RA00001 [Ceratocystis fimbriata CBS 114723]|uniref:Uncharacterized protein n=1 Tax=Ceratocystis fimbriata CBS 114723 TaxID=1035309 RepID=A0A2C5X5K5_9PEZI|nr:hypothetical protein CFIMG_008293RA00001 [Ceratocystis fimbriata CBS 114723]